MPSYGTHSKAYTVWYTAAEWQKGITDNFCQNWVITTNRSRVTKPSYQLELSNSSVETSKTLKYQLKKQILCTSQWESGTVIGNYLEIINMSVMPYLSWVGSIGNYTKLLHTSKQLDRFNQNFNITSLEWLFFKWNRTIKFWKIGLCTFNDLVWHLEYK